MKADFKFIFFLNLFSIINPKLLDISYKLNSFFFFKYLCCVHDYDGFFTENGVF